MVFTDSPERRASSPICTRSMVDSPVGGDTSRRSFVHRRTARYGGDPATHAIGFGLPLRRFGFAAVSRDHLLATIGLVPVAAGGGGRPCGPRGRSVDRLFWRLFGCPESPRRRHVTA